MTDKIHKVLCELTTVKDKKRKGIRSVPFQHREQQTTGQGVQVPSSRARGRGTRTSTKHDFRIDQGCPERRAVSNWAKDGNGARTHTSLVRPSLEALKATFGRAAGREGKRDGKYWRTAKC